MRARSLTITTITTTIFRPSFFLAVELYPPTAGELQRSEKNAPLLLLLCR